MGFAYALNTGFAHACGLRSNEGFAHACGLRLNEGGSVRYVVASAPASAEPFRSVNDQNQPVGGRLELALWIL
jgi:hypothetical protein